MSDAKVRVFNEFDFFPRTLDGLTALADLDAQPVPCGRMTVEERDALDDAMEARGAQPQQLVPDDWEITCGGEDMMPCPIAHASAAELARGRK